jgi:hypothetical protein
MIRRVDRRLGDTRWLLRVEVKVDEARRRMYIGGKYGMLRSSIVGTRQRNERSLERYAQRLGLFILVMTSSCLSPSVP